MVKVGRGLVHRFEDLAELFGVRDQHLGTDDIHINIDYNLLGQVRIEWDGTGRSGDEVRARTSLIAPGHHADGVLGIGVDLGLEDGDDCVGECAEAYALVVAILHVL